MNLFGGKPFGIYITDSFVQVLQLTGNAKKIQVRAIGEKEIPPGIVANGELRKEKELADIILALLEEAKPKKIKQKKCIVALPDQQCFKYIYHLPANLVEEELEKAIAEKIQKTIPIPFHEIKYDFVTYPLGEQQVIFVTVVPRVIIAQFYEVLKNLCGLNPIVFEPESLSLVRNLPIEFNTSEGAILVYKKADAIKWMSFWGGLIFDENTISVAENANIEDVLLKDLEGSVKFFKKNTNQNIGKIILDTNLTNVSLLEESIETKLKLPVKKTSNYHVDLAKIGLDNPNKFNIVAGASLASLSEKAGVLINLLKKQEG